MRAEDAESLAIGGGHSDRVAGGAIRVGIVLRAVRADKSERSAQFRIADSGQGRYVDRLAGIAARLFSVLPPCFLRCRPTIASTTPRWSASRSPRRDEVIGQGPSLIERPGLESRHEPGLIDQANLEGEQAEEQISRWVELTWRGRHRFSPRYQGSLVSAPQPRKYSSNNDLTRVFCSDATTTAEYVSHGGRCDIHAISCAVRAISFRRLEYSTSRTAWSSSQRRILAAVVDFYGLDDAVLSRPHNPRLARAYAARLCRRHTEMSLRG